MHLHGVISGFNGVSSSSKQILHYLSKSLLILLVVFATRPPLTIGYIFKNSLGTPAPISSSSSAAAIVSNNLFPVLFTVVVVYLKRYLIVKLNLHINFLCIFNWQSNFSGFILFQELLLIIIKLSH